MSKRNYVWLTFLKSAWIHESLRPYNVWYIIATLTLSSTNMRKNGYNAAQLIIDAIIVPRLMKLLSFYPVLMTLLTHLPETDL
jgi:hypothetical protein